MHKNQFLSLLGSCDFLTPGQREELTAVAEVASPEQLDAVAKEMTDSADRRSALYKNATDQVVTIEKNFKKQKRKQDEAADAAATLLPDL